MLPNRILSVAAVLIGSMMVTPAEAVSAHRVNPGDVYVTKPVHFVPQHPGDSGPSGHRNHPVIALSHPNREGYVPVVAVSHNHPEHMGQTSRASHYHEYTKAGTEKHFSSGSKVATGRPVHVHHDDLHRVSGDSDLPPRLHEQDRDNLIDKVYEHSGQFHRNDPHHSPPPLWRQTPSGH